ncbi:hypothetical protein [Taibaiella koreensis]|uniref:hypothetical protein n=1 Tax=Taibaiella koreensis TaxID=1268548 RepID=UPI000E59B0C2|nr:hypothetical protein [Taibaiella koreensis]
MMKKNLIAAVLLFISFNNYAQINDIEKVSGEYLVTDSTFDAGAHSRLSLFKNGQYKYETGTHLQIYHSYGVWKLKGDTVILNSSIDEENIPIMIKESKIDSLNESIVIALVKNLDGDIMDASFKFNSDTTLVCDPLLQDGCLRKAGSIRNIKISFSSRASTKWYKIKNRKANLIEVIANVHDVLSLYLFFRNEQFFLKNGNLFYLLKDKTKNEKGIILKKLE